MELTNDIDNMKVIEYLKRFLDIRRNRKCRFKPKDWVLTTGIEGGVWTLCRYSHFNEYGNHVFIGGTRSKICIPYNKKTAHLLGTKEEWKE